MTIAENDEIISNASDTAKALNRLFSNFAIAQYKI